MSLKVNVNRELFSSVVFLRVLYYYAKVLGIVCFTITDKARLKPSMRAQLYSVSCRLGSLIAYTLIIPKASKYLPFIKHIQIRAMIVIQVLSIAIFTVGSITFQVVRYKQFVGVCNRAIDLNFRISKTTGNAKVFGYKFCLLILARMAGNIYGIITDVPMFNPLVSEKDIVFLALSLIGCILWFGAIIVVDLLCLGYMTAAGMYQNIGNHMKLLADRITKTESNPGTKFHQMQMLCDYSDELEECSAIYSQIFKITTEFHSMFQFNILFTFYIDIILIISNIHYNFLTYISSGEMVWSFVGHGTVRLADILFLMMVIDMAVRRSKIPQYQNWDSLCSDIDERWDRSVDHFLNQLRFEDLKMNVYGLFELNNSLCLWIFSVIVAYLTILIQFDMLGFFEYNS